MRVQTYVTVYTRIIHPTKTTATQNEVALSYRSVCRAIFAGSCFCEKYRMYGSIVPAQAGSGVA